MTAGVQDDVATSIPVSCDGVKTHVFMDDSIAFLRKYRFRLFSYGGGGAGRACVDDLVVNLQAIDIAEAILCRIGRLNVM